MKITDFDPTDININLYEPKGEAAKRGATKKIYVNAGSGREAIRLQLCNFNVDEMLRVPFGVSEPREGAAENGKRSMEVALEHGNPAHEHLIASIRSIENQIKKYAHTNSQQIFNKQLSEESIEERFMSMLRCCEPNTGRSNLLRTKIALDCEVLGVHEINDGAVKAHKSNIKILENNSRTVPSIEFSSVWFVANYMQFGFSLNITTIVVDQTKNQRRVVPQGVAAFVMEPGMTMQIDSGDDADAVVSEPLAKRQRVGAEQRTDSDDDISNYLE